jgi:anti-sigma regulatory factor (Ser/Thr protein kinase)
MARLHIQLAPTLHAASEARAWIGGWLREERAGDDIADDVLTVVSELVTNSVRHATRSEATLLWLSAERDGDGVRLAVHDDGTSGCVEPRRSEISGDRIGGFGLQLVASLATTWGVERDGQGTLVWARLPL